MGLFLGVIWVLKVQAWGWPPYSMGLIILGPIIKDGIDVVMDVALKGPFKINYKELIADWITDDIYWGIELAFAIVTIGIEGEGVWLWQCIPFLVGVILALALAFGFWLPRKRMFDYSRMPFNFVRLIKYPEPDRFLNDNSRSELRAFQDYARDHSKSVVAGNSAVPKHYVIMGGRPIVRSGLAVSMGCEYIYAGKVPI